MLRLDPAMFIPPPVGLLPPAQGLFANGLENAIFPCPKRVVWQIDAVSRMRSTRPAGRFGIHPAAAVPDALTPAMPTRDFRARDNITPRPANGIYASRTSDG